MYHKDFERIRLSVGRELLKLLKKVDQTRKPILLDCVGGPTVVVLNLEEFESISATLELEESPETREALRKSLSEAKTGKYRTHEEVFGHPIDQAPPEG